METQHKMLVQYPGIVVLCDRCSSESLSIFSMKTPTTPVHQNLKRRRIRSTAITVTKEVFMADKGRFVWYELGTRAPEKALDFYTKVAGWGSKKWDMAPIPYTILTRSADDETGVGGMFTMSEPDFPPDLPSHFMASLYTENVDATAERTKELGGKVHHGPADIPEVGRFAIIEDPQGAFIALLQTNGPASEGEKEPQMGDFVWNELMTTDYAAAFDFYKDLFNWQIDQDMPMDDNMIYRIFRPEGGERSVGGIFTKPADMPGPSAWLYYINVPDLNAALETVKENGGQVLNGPMQVPGGAHIAQCTDPEGTFFALHTPPAGE